DPDDLEGGQTPVAVGDEALGGHRVDALAALLVGRGDAVHVRPLGPGVVGAPPVRWARQDLELVDRRRALAMRGAEAVRPGGATADDDDALALGAGEVLRGDRVALAPPVLEGQGF